MQVEPVGLSNLFDSLSVNERQENKYDLRKLPFLVSIGLVGKGRGPSEQACQKHKHFTLKTSSRPLVCVKSELEEVAWLFFLLPLSNTNKCPRSQLPPNPVLKADFHDPISNRS